MAAATIARAARRTVTNTARRLTFMTRSHSAGSRSRNDTKPDTPALAKTYRGVPSSSTTRAYAAPSASSSVTSHAMRRSAGPASFGSNDATLQLSRCNSSHPAAPRPLAPPVMRPTPGSRVNMMSPERAEPAARAELRMQHVFAPEDLPGHDARVGGGDAERRLG